MVYFDYGQNRYVCSTPTVIPDIRAHFANWQHFRWLTGTWPILSIFTFLMRFFLITGVATFCVWYGLARHGWTGNQYYLIAIGIGIPLMVLWFIAERWAWNHDLRSKGLTSNSDVWGIDQFPPKEKQHRRIR
jgi:hypothetical protein